MYNIVLKSYDAYFYNNKNTFTCKKKKNKKTEFTQQQNIMGYKNNEMPKEMKSQEI